MNYDNCNIDSIEEYALTLLDKNLLEVLGSNNFRIKESKSKGRLGQVVEEEFFGYNINSVKDADFKEVGVELKVCPLKQIKKNEKSDVLRLREGIAAKERVVLSIINYMDIYNEIWDTNTLMKKLSKILFMFYMYEKDKRIEEYIFNIISLWEPSESDLEVIKSDWNIILSKINEGKAHEISEGDTMYLGACTKGSTAEKSKRKQPFSDVMAPQRAFCLKNSYVNSIIDELLNRKYYSKNKNKELYIEGKTFDKIILDRLNIEIGKNLKDIMSQLEINRERKAKNFINLVVNDIFEKKFGARINEIIEFEKSNIEVRTVLIKNNGMPKESMSFDLINYTEILEENWEDSDIRQRFENKKILWVVFKTEKNYSKQSELNLEDIVLHKIKFWNMSIEDLDNDMKYVWQDTVNKIKNGIYNDFIKISDNKKFHVRDKGRNSNDCMLTPQGTFEKKRAFWLNASYIKEIIEKED